MVQKLIPSKSYILRALDIAARRYEVLANRFGHDAPLCDGESATYGGEAENFKALSDAIFAERLKLSSAIVVSGKPDTPAQRVEPLPRAPKLKPENFEL